VAAAERYALDKLNMLCADFLSSDITLENALDIFAMASALGSDNEAIREFLNDNTDDIFEHDTFLNLSRDNLRKIIGDDGLGIEEIALFDAVIRWAENQAKITKNDKSDAVKDIIGDMINLIRFPLMSIQEVVGPVAKHGLIDQTTMLSLLSYSGITDESARKKMHIAFPTKPREGGLVAKDSKILTKKHKKNLARLFEGKKLKMELLFRASRDGYDATSFHGKSDNKGPTLVVIKSGQYIFGGYNPENWHQSSSYIASGCWIYALDNPQNLCCKFMQSGSSGAYCGSGYGPTWGGGHDLHINGSMQSNSNYSSPNNFTQPASGFSGSLSNSTLAGSYNFTVAELEVWSIKYKTS